MARYRQIVFTNPVEGREGEFNRWYDEVHLPEVLAVPGFLSATRYAVTQPGGDIPSHRYVAIYEMEADDPDAVLAEVGARVERGEIAISDTISSDVRILLLNEISRREA